MGALGEQSSSLLLSQAAKSAGVPCSPAQLYFLALEQVRLCMSFPCHTYHLVAHSLLTPDTCSLSAFG